MDKTHKEAAVEQRRTLLKGALGASTVMTLGYGGAAAAASLTCIAKVDGGFPTTQFVFAESPPPATGGGWAWKRIDVNLYSSTGSTNGNCNPNANGNFEGFTVAGNVYNVAPPQNLVPTAVLKSCGAPYPKTAWVLAYFDESGNEIGTYPTYSDQGTGFAPAAHSCLTSINPGIVENYTFGG